MRISIKYFASLRELMGEATCNREVDEGLSVEDLWTSVIQEKGVSFDTVMMAVNMEYVKPKHELQDGDEVAFFPPVTGG